MKSKAKLIADRLASGGSITSLEAFENYHITRLSSVIHRLRGQGWNITTDMVQIGTGKNRVTFARYRKI